MEINLTLTLRRINILKILTIETSGKMCGVSILEDKNLIEKIEINNGLTHSESLMPIINELFKKTNIKLNDINLLVCDIGPGSFTGIRIGVATAKAFCDSLKIKTIGISSLTALAYNSKNCGLICTMIDAKNNNCYYALYELKNNKYETLISPTAETIENVVTNLKKYNKKITFIGDASENYKDTLSKISNEITFLEDNSIHSYNLALAGLDTFLLGTYNKELLPLYLKKPQAERQLEEKQLLMKGKI